LALRKSEFNDAGAVLAGISVDSAGQNAAWIEQDGLNFPILSDPDRSIAITPYGLANPTDPRKIALPATVIVGPDGVEVGRIVSEDYADRPYEELTLEFLTDLGLPPIEQPDATPGTPEPGKGLMPIDKLGAYFRGAKFAAKAMGRRFPEAKENSDVYAATMDRYLAAVKEMRTRLAG
jgi:hypothetical protein